MFLSSGRTLFTCTKRTVGISTTARQEEWISGLDKLQGEGLCGNNHKHVSVSLWGSPLFTVYLLDCFIYRKGEHYLTSCNSD